MKKLILIFFLMSLAGCAGLNVPDYIKADHPVARRVTGSYPKIVDAIKVALFKERWDIRGVDNPSIYERLPSGENQAQDIVFFTKIKTHQKFIYSSHEHLNVFVHVVAEGAEVDVRYEVIESSIFGRFHKLRNDRLANHLLDLIEEELESR